MPVNTTRGTTRAADGNGTADVAAASTATYGQQRPDRGEQP
ncbi:hypothetical protein [Halorientalis marina]|nr:hypothetical protein [Halorientalis marina]